MKISGGEKHFPLLNYFIVRNNPQTTGINIRKKRIAKKNSTFNSTFRTLPLHTISLEVTVDRSNNKIQTQRISDSLVGK